MKSNLPMIIYTLNFLLTILIGSMIFFMAVVSPSVFATLSTNASSKFLRTIFPRMFLFGFIIALLSLILSYISANNINSILLVIVSTLIFFTLDDVILCTLSPSG
mgnify:CR=1 FL=1